MKPNQGIRNKAKENNVYLWEIGNYLEVTEQTIIRWLRKEPMLHYQEEAIMKAIKEISATKAKG